MKLTESYSIDEAFKVLKEDVEDLDEKLSYAGFQDLFDQVYCSLTHGEDRGMPRKILGDLGRVETKYSDYDVSVDYSLPGATRIGVVAPSEYIGNAVAVAEIYNLDYDVKSFGSNLSKVFITVPESEPVNKEVLHYVDTEGKLKDISHIYNKSGSRATAQTDKRELITASADMSSDKEMLKETVETSMPVTPLNSSDIYSFIENIPEATGTRPPQAFKLGYIREMLTEVAAKYRGGRGSGDQPRVRIFKATEYSRLYTKAAYENLGSTKDYRKETGKEASHDRTGFNFSRSETDGILNAIGTYPNGEAALQAYRMKDNKIKVAYFISFDDSDLVPASKEDIAAYLTPAAASKLLGTRDVDAPKSADNVNRFKISGIYMIGNIGNSII